MFYKIIISLPCFIIVIINSAGVGRTGTFLQLENLTRMNTDHSAIQQNVEHMRRQRVHMVQSVVSKIKSVKSLFKLVE